MKDKIFWEIVERCREQVSKWPEWKQRIEITSETIMSGRFLKPKKKSK